MGRVDDRREMLDAEHAKVRHRRGAALIFVGPELAGAGAGRIVLHLVGNGGERLLLRAAHDRRDQPAGDRHGHAHIGGAMLEHGALGPGHIGVGHAHQSQSHALDDEIIDRDLVGGLAIDRRRRLVDLLAQGQQLVEIAIHRQVEMRDRLLGLHEAARDGLAHGIMRDLFVAAGLVELLDLLVAHGRDRRARGLRGGGSGGCGRSFHAASDGGLHVALDDAAMGAGAAHDGQIKPRVLGDATRQRRGEHARASDGRCGCGGGWR